MGASFGELKEFLLIRPEDARLGRHTRDDPQHRDPVPAHTYPCAQTHPQTLFIQLLQTELKLHSETHIIIHI